MLSPKPVQCAADLALFGLILFGLILFGCMLFGFIVLDLTLCGRPLGELRWGGPALPGEGEVPKEDRPPNPEWLPSSGKAKTLDLSISVAVDNRVRDTNNNIAIFFKDFEPFSTNRKFDGSICLEQSIKNFSILDSDLALFCPYISFKTCLLKTDWNTKFKYIKYNYDKDGL